MTAKWLLADALASSPVTLPALLLLVLAVQVGGWLAAERICKLVARRRDRRRRP